MEDFEITFTLDEPFGPLKKRIKEIIGLEREYEYSEASIIEITLNEYDVFIYYQGEEFFNATVNFDEFLYEILRFALYALSSEIPKNTKSYGGSFNNIDELPEWLNKEVKVLKGLLKDKFDELTSMPFLRSSLGSYDPILRTYVFRHRDEFYIVNIDYRKVAVLPAREFTVVILKTVEDAINELETGVGISEKHGIKEYKRLLMDIRLLVGKLREKMGTL
ncbi:hypothetical protein NF865_01730 [Thermococcus aggregans]|uniref:Uncharacterized protein n=1 Tax=Thermococcus aggregans TaxID=110163 RepID=A0A9E7MY14_THEAG|nr:hypothetical protein [Thermococcus aggregans]USS40965.1 hypothetical protein NF865_01730 [Thermococcus aggregans]